MSLSVILRQLAAVLAWVAERMKSGFWRRLRSFNLLKKGAERARAKGATAVEMALLAPAFFMMFIGITEISLVVLVQHVMENATYNASRLAKTGYVAEGKTQLETIMDVMDREMGSLSPLVDVTKLSVYSTAYGNLSNIGQPEQGEEGLGAAGQVVVYTVSYPWKMFTPMIGNIIGDENGKITINSRIVVRNEPY